MAEQKNEPICRFVWHNGSIRASNEATLPIWTNALHYGTGVFEGIRAYPTARGLAAFRVREHMERLIRSARHYAMSLKWSAEELSRATVDVLLKENFSGAAYVRPLVFYGEGPPQMNVKKGCPVEAMIMTRPLGAFLGEENYKKGIRMTVAPWRKIHCSTLPTTAKGTGQYANSVICAHEAVDRGFDDALLLTVEGMVSEATGANVFFVRDGRLYTNDASSSILLGITRESVLQIARDRGIEVVIKSFALSELQDADEVFITGTAAEVTPVRAIDARTYVVTDSSMTRMLQTAYKDVVEGRDAKYEKWLTYVR